MSGWTKLFSSIVTSSVWCEDHVTLRVWVAMLATADDDGIVEGTIPGFANLARVTVDEMRAAVVKLSSPDLDSRTAAHEGRRIEPIEGGWLVLNYLRYRERAQAKDGSRAPYYRAYRARKAAEKAAAEAESRNTPATPPATPNVARNTDSDNTDSDSENVNGFARSARGVQSAPATKGTNGNGALKATATTDNGKTPSWSREASEDWTAAKGGPAPKAIFPALKAAVTAHGWPAIRPVWKFYLASTAAEFVNVPKFAATFGEWEKRANGKAALSTTGTVGEKSLAAVGRFLQRGEQ